MLRAERKKKKKKKAKKFLPAKDRSPAKELNNDDIIPRLRITQIDPRGDYLIRVEDGIYPGVLRILPLSAIGSDSKKVGLPLMDIISKWHTAKAF